MKLASALISLTTAVAVLAATPVAGSAAGALAKLDKVKDGVDDAVHAKVDTAKAFVADAGASLAVKAGKANGTHTTPVAVTKSWKYYSFDVLNTNFVYTSILPDPASPLAPGTVATVYGELFDAGGTRVGVNQWVRTVIGTDPELPGGASRALISVAYEFGTASDGYFDDALFVSVVSKRVSGAADFADYDAAITGGTGRFMGATGTLTISKAIFPFMNNTVVSGTVHFDAYVPADLPARGEVGL